MKETTLAPRRLDVSVIIPVFNRADLASRAILSVFGQRGLSIELIVIDDGSTDETGALLAKLRADRSGFEFHLLRCAQNAGPAVARNLGLNAAQGEFIAFLDSDDTFADLSVLADMVTRARNDGLDLLVAPFCADNEPDLRALSSIAVEEEVVCAASAPQLANMRSIWQGLYRREFLRCAGICFDEATRSREDRPFVLDTLLSAQRIGVFGRAVICYSVQGSESLSARSDETEFSYYLRHVDHVISTLERARATGRLHPRFEVRNAALYVTAQLGHWHEQWRAALDRNARYPELIDLFQRLLGPTGPLFRLADEVPRDKIVQQAGDDLISGRLDLFRLGILMENARFIRAALDGEALDLDELYAFGCDPEAHHNASDVNARLLSFLGPRRVSATCAKAPATLGEIVPRIVLHVGGMKTGSSAFQHYMESNRFALLQQGYFYPATGTQREKGIRALRNPGHGALIIRLKDPVRRAELMAEMAQEVAALPDPPHTMILSAETILSSHHWEAREGGGFDRLCAAIGGKIEVIWARRNSQDWLRSIHREWLGNPRQAFDASPGELARDFEALGLLDDDSLERDLRRPAEVEALHRQDYEEMRDGRGTPAQFCAIIGIDDKGFVPLPNGLANRSLSNDQLELIALLKKIPGLTVSQRDRGFQAILDAQPPVDAEAFFLEFLDTILPNKVAQSRLRSLRQGALTAPDELDIFLMPGGWQVLRLPSDQTWKTARISDKFFFPLRFADMQLIAVDPSDVPKSDDLHLIGDHEERHISISIQRDAALGRHVIKVPSWADPAPALPMLLVNQADLAASGPRQIEQGQPNMCEVVIPGARNMSDVRAALSLAVKRGDLKITGEHTKSHDSVPWFGKASDIPFAALDQVAKPPDWAEFVDKGFYNRTYPDVAAAGVDPVLHYRRHGASEGRLPVSGWLPRPERGHDDFANVVQTSLRVQIAVEYVTQPDAQPQAAPPRDNTFRSHTKLLMPHIDVDYYAKQAGRLFQGPRQAAKHFINKGAAKGLDPAPWFSSKAYLARHPDVAKSGSNPFVHYLLFGRQEHRSIANAEAASTEITIPWKDLETAGLAMRAYEPEFSFMLPYNLTTTTAPASGLLPAFRALRRSVVESHARVIAILSAQVAPVDGVFVLPPADLLKAMPLAGEQPSTDRARLLIELSRAAGVETVIGQDEPVFREALSVYGRQLTAERRVVMVAHNVPEPLRSLVHHVYQPDTPKGASTLRAILKTEIERL